MLLHLRSTENEELKTSQEASIQLRLIKAEIVEDQIHTH
jgi:hypothetical protein